MIYFATGRSYSWLQKKKLGMVSRKKASKENVQKALQMYAEGQDISAIIQTTKVATSTLKRKCLFTEPAGCKHKYGNHLIHSECNKSSSN